MSLALGVGGTTAVFAVFSALTLRPLPFPDEDRLVQLGIEVEGGGRGPVFSAPLARDLLALDGVFESLALHRALGGHAVETGSGGPAKHFMLQLTSPEFFDSLDIRAELGRTFTARGPAPDGEDVVVMRRGIWLAEYGGKPLIGQTIRLDGVPKVVLGIIADDQALPAWGDMWSPSRERMADGGYLNFYLRGLGKLAPGVTLEGARERLHQLGQAKQVRTPQGALVAPTVTPLREALLGPEGGPLPTLGGTVLLMLAAMGAFALLACANLAALLATRASVRQRELAVRSVLGASHWALARQQALEASLLVLLGGVLGLGLARHFIEVWANDYRDMLGNLPPRLDLRVVAGFVGLLVLTAAFGTLVPAAVARRVQPMDALRGEGRSSPNRRARRARELLVGIQVAVTLALLVNAGLLVRSVRALLAVDPGFQPRGVVTATVDLPTIRRGVNGADRDDQHRDAQRRLQPLFDGLGTALRAYGVDGVCLANEVPFDHNVEIGQIEPEASSQRPVERALMHWVYPGCLATLGIPLLSGRDLELQDSPSRPVAIANRAFAQRVLGVDDATGHRFRMAGPSGSGSAPPWIDIVGMSGDAHETDLTEPAPPAVYLSLFLDSLRMGGEASVFFSVAVRATGDLDALAAALPRAIGELSRDAAVFEVTPLDGWIASSFRERAALQRLLTAFGVAAALLAAVGLFGVTSYAVTERSAEIGIRRALGASRGDVLRMILGETAAVLGLGVAAGLLLAWVARGFLQAYLFGVSEHDPWTIGGVCCGTFAIGLLAALAPARTAAGISPSSALAGR